ncbi:MAG: electron transfer flavoprotein subunit beta/FixA family protein [Elusimicrobiota bacterium]
MSLQVLVCVKQTPSSTSVAVDPATGAPKADAACAMNPLDEYAVEEALRLKERVPGTKALALSLGTPACEETLRAALALGIDEAALLTDPAFAGSDPLASAYLLSLAVRKAGTGPQLVLAGRQSSDGESGAVPPALAAWLGWPCASSVRKVLEVSETSVTVERAMEDGAETLRLPLPAVLSVTKEINEPRLPSLKGKMAARKAALPRWGAAELGAEPSKFGAASAAVPAGTVPVPQRPPGAVVPGATAEEKAAALVARLKEMKLL